MTTNKLDFGEPIYTYTMHDAIADGMLVDMTEKAKGYGFKDVYVVLTQKLWNAIENIPQGRKGIEDLEGRLHDVLWMAKWAAGKAKNDHSTLFPLFLSVKGTRKKKQILQMVIDGASPEETKAVITIGFQDDEW